MEQITVDKLSKVYRVPVREAGFAASFKTLFKKHYKSVDAVKDISFTINEGEIVGFLGPNGAGKTTTLKMLSGLLYPSSGNVRVDGYVPWEKNHAYLQKISMLMGNKSQLLWDIPPIDTFHVLGAIYRLSKDDVSRTVGDLAELLEVNDVLKKPVRNMSLGGRMKCELIAALLHKPKILFLDEPTIGLDISTQMKFRTFIREYNNIYKSTIILTSHYMADVSALCSRVIFIHHGRLLFDGNLHTLIQDAMPIKLIKFTLSKELSAIQLGELTELAEITHREPFKISLAAHRDLTSKIITSLLAKLPISDLSIEDPPLESVVNQIYQSEQK